jgi:carboxylesterase
VNKKVIKSALPLYLPGEGKKAVLIIHGYTGFAGEFYDLAQNIHSLGYTVSLPRLPGHGTNRKDFKATNDRDWLSHVENCYADLEAGHDEVYVVGLSMGGILALLVAARFNPKRVVLLAPAMAMHSTVFYLTPFLRFILPDQKSDWNPDQEAGEDWQTLGREYWSVTMIGQLAKLRRLQKRAIGELSEIHSPILLMLSEKDDSVSLKAESVIKSGLKDCPVTTEILKESHHVLVTGVEKDYVNKRVKDWLERGE